LERQVAWVTGGARGIGRATAEALLVQGAHVLLTDRDAAALEKAREELVVTFGKRMATATVDVVNADIDQACGLCIERFGGLDIVVSNAGTAPEGDLHSAEGDNQLRASLDVNLLGHQRVAGAAVRCFIEQGIGGCLLFNASKSAFNQGPRFGPYAVAKAALVALMREYAVDYGRYGVRSNAVNADRVRTGLFGGGVLEARAKARGVSTSEYFKQNLLGRETLASDVAEAFAWLASASATTGCVVTVDGGNPAAFPR
jgi:NAD(P)-dependent dehydrogenase (short-subunit alcohol dehydrogenase family)